LVERVCSVKFDPKYCANCDKFNAQKCDNVPVNAFLFSIIVHEDLSELNRSKGHSMHREEKIICVNCSSISNRRVDKSLEIVNGIEVKANWIKHREFNRKASA